ncbi:T9SS type A sorting domain-containing protein [Dyadobacter diqingensis]|uniref:T9SS type A sorting domain-containing protein n=1 Tax=Dyadobacter diqingensis TaxID=2938121 RepID=UPI0020C1AC8D|nr:T9SS type A sorting domain-containing protein [Dyadobacter diqingensis]
MGKVFSKLTIAGLLLLFHVTAFAQSYEAESGTVSNGADIQNCGACSGSSQVGNLGGGAVLIPVVVSQTGIYNLTIAYSTGDPRTINVTPNGGNYISVSCPASGGWSTPASTTVRIALVAGSNSLKLDNVNGYGPNIDKIFLSAANAPDVRSITFGADNRIDYDLNNGYYDVYFNNEKVISDASSSASSNSVFKSTVGYTSRVYSSNAVTDNFGTGTKHVITMTGTGLLEMQQVFYTYPGKNYFFTETILNGSGSNCYRMSPLTSNLVDIHANADRRALFVPFDNDAWVRYDAKEIRYANFFSSEAGAIYDNTSRKGLVIGSVEHGVWKTGVNLVGEGRGQTAYLSVQAGWTQESVTRDKRGHGWVSVGQNSCKSPKIMVSYDTDWRNGFDNYGKANAAAEPRYIFNWNEATPFGWNSWGAIQSNINLAKAKSVVDFFSTGVPNYRNDDNTLYIDLDSYWDNMSGGGLTGDFSQLTEFANYCKSKGFKPGIYWAPFVDWGKFGRQMEGSTQNYQDAWTKVNGGPQELDGAYALDPTHPGTKDRIQLVIGKFKACGFEMIKIDFLGHAALEADSYYDNTVHTGMEAFKKGMEFLTDQLDGKMLVYAAISPNLATGRYAHMRRIACDSYKDINETSYTLNSTTYGWWQKHIYNYLDADHIVFGNEPDGENRARLASGIVTGALITGDDYSATGTWTAKSQTLLQNADLLNLAKNGLAFSPVEGNTGNQANELFVLTKGSKSYLAIFNYSGSAKTFSVDLTRVGLSGTDVYTTKELFSGASTNQRQMAANAQGTFSITLPAADAAIVEFGNTVLPVNLTSFSAQKSFSGTSLNWKTSGETSNKEFVIERSTDAKTFNAIGKVSGSGDSKAGQTYAFNDPAPVQNEINYYRLKQIDFDGAFEHSRIAAVDYKNLAPENQAYLFPNPGSDVLNIRLNNLLEGNVTIQINDLKGTNLIERSYENPSEIIPVPGVGKFLPGTYLIEVKSEKGQSQQMKFVKE